MGLTVVVVDLGEKVEGGNLGFDLGMKERKEGRVRASKTRINEWECASECVWFL